MSEAKFKKAVEIVQSLPKDGDVQPTQDDQLYVSFSRFFFIRREQRELTTAIARV